jgi:hypothetical protein
MAHQKRSSYRTEILLGRFFVRGLLAGSVKG